MTMHPEWIKWAGHHGTVFSLNRADDLQTLLAWAGLFERNGFEPWHLTAATDHLAFNDPPKFRAEHLRGLRRSLRALAEAEQRRVARERPPDHRACLWCGDTGLVSVPRLSNQRLAVWETAAVTCRCFQGQQTHQRLEERVPSLWTLERYEAVNPEWTRQTRAHEALEQAERNP
jgi:hypothetical protein